jgi:hypothetical protein
MASTGIDSAKQNRRLISLGLIITITILLIASVAYGYSEILPRTRTGSRVVVTLQRSGCFGACPSYKLTIFGNGIVIYRGDRFVSQDGIRITTIGQEKVSQLISAFKAANYFGLKDEYLNYEITDNPVVATSLTIDDKSKRIDHYLGDSSAPTDLTKPENEIDEIINSSQWIIKADV